jgi:hypothetical protein
MKNRPTTPPETTLVTLPLDWLDPNYAILLEHYVTKAITLTGRELPLLGLEPYVTRVYNIAVAHQEALTLGQLASGSSLPAQDAEQQQREELFIFFYDRYKRPHIPPTNLSSCAVSATPIGSPPLTFHLNPST